MANTIGKLIGIVWHTFKTKLDNGDVVTLKIGFDFSNASDTDCRAWLTSNRVIAFQRPVRTLTASELEKIDGSAIDASTCGRKIESARNKFIASVRTVKSIMPEKASELVDEWNENHDDQISFDEI